MKKNASILLAVLLVLSLAACAKTAEPAETTTASAETAAPETEATQAGLSSAAEINAIFDSLDMTEPETLGSVKKLGQYTGLELVTKKAAVISDADVEDYLNQNILPNYKQEVDGPVQEGDTVNIDYAGTKDGVAFEGGTAAGQDLGIGSGQFIDGFESGLVGAKKGETRKLDLTFPENYQKEDLAGQAVVFTVTVNSISRQSELTDEIAAQVDSENPTAEKLRASIKDFLQEEEDLNATQELYYIAACKVIDDSELEVDEKAVEYTTNTYLKNYAAQCQQYYGIDVGTLFSYMGGTYEELRSQYETISEETVKQRLVLQEIAKKENLQVTDDDMTVFAGMYGYTTDQLIGSVGEEQAGQLVLEDKASQFIVSHSTVTYEEAAE